jgi:Tfp pilus assembly protein PilF
MLNTRILSLVNEPQPVDPTLNRLVCAMAGVAQALKALELARHELHEAMAESDAHDSGDLLVNREVDACDPLQPAQGQRRWRDAARENLRQRGV